MGGGGEMGEGGREEGGGGGEWGGCVRGGSVRGREGRFRGWGWGPGMVEVERVGLAIGKFNTLMYAGMRKQMGVEV